MAEMYLTETPAMDVSVAELGQGTPVLYLHDVLFDLVGVDGQAPRFLENLAKSHRIFAPALPGFRDLKQLEGFTSVADYVLLVQDLLSLLGLNRPHVIGTGLGAWIASELAVFHPDSIGTLTLVNAFGLQVDGHPTARFFDAGAPNPLGGRREIRGLLFAAPDASPGVDILPDFPDDETNERYFTHVHAAARIGWEPPAFYDPRLLGRLGRITAPTHVVWGAENHLVDIAHAKAFESGIGAAKLTVLQGAGQAITVEQPDALAEAVTTFLQAHDR
jgi:pimeloyl-ACP methyl ester carboxylesterase